MLERLPCELLVSCAYYLDLKSLFALNATNSLVRTSLHMDNRLWRDFYYERWPLLDTSWQFSRLTWWLNQPLSPAPFVNWQEKLLDRLLVERAWRKGPQMAERTVIHLSSLANITTSTITNLATTPVTGTTSSVNTKGYNYSFKGKKGKSPSVVKKRPTVRIRTVHIVEQDQVYLCRNDGSIFSFNLITGEGTLLSQPEKNYDVALGDVLPSRDSYPCDSSVFCDTERLAVIQNSGNGYRWMRIFNASGCIEWRLFTSTVKPRIFGSVLYALQWQRGRWPPMLSRWQLPSPCSCSDVPVDSDVLEDDSCCSSDFEEVLLDKVVSLSTIEQADNYFLVPLNSLVVISQIEGRWFTWSEFDISVEPPLLKRSRREYVDFFVRSRFSANAKHVVAIGDFPVELRFYPRQASYNEEGEEEDASWKLLLEGILSDLLYLADLDIYVVLCAAMIDRNFLLQAYSADPTANREPLWQITTSIQHQVGSHRLHRAGGYIRRVSADVILVWGTDCLQAFDLSQGGESLWRLRIFDGVVDTNGRRLACRTAQGKISVFDFGLPPSALPSNFSSSLPSASFTTHSSSVVDFEDTSASAELSIPATLNKKPSWKRLGLVKRLFQQLSST